MAQQIPHIEIDEDRQVLIVAVPYYPSFIQDLRQRDLHGTWIKEKKHYEFSLALLPEVVACLNRNFPKIEQTPSVALAALLSHLDEEDLLGLYRVLARKYRTGTMRELLVHTFGPFIHIEREIIASKPARRIEIESDDDIRTVEEVIEDPSSNFAEMLRDLETRRPIAAPQSRADRIRQTIQEERESVQERRPEPPNNWRRRR